MIPWGWIFLCGIGGLFSLFAEGGQRRREMVKSLERQGEAPVQVCPSGTHLLQSTSSVPAMSLEEAAKICRMGKLEAKVRSQNKRMGEACYQAGVAYLGDKDKAKQIFGRSFLEKAFSEGVPCAGFWLYQNAYSKLIENERTAGLKKYSDSAQTCVKNRCGTVESMKASPKECLAVASMAHYYETRSILSTERERCAFADRLLSLSDLSQEQKKHLFFDITHLMERENCFQNDPKRAQTYLQWAQKHELQFADRGPTGYFPTNVLPFIRLFSGEELESLLDRIKGQSDNSNCHGILKNCSHVYQTVKMAQLQLDWERLLKSKCSPESSYEGCEEAYEKLPQNTKTEFSLRMNQVSELSPWIVSQASLSITVPSSALKKCLEKEEQQVTSYDHCDWVRQVSYQSNRQLVLTSQKKMLETIDDTCKQGNKECKKSIKSTEMQTLFQALYERDPWTYADPKQDLQKAQCQFWGIHRYDANFSAQNSFFQDIYQNWIPSPQKCTSKVSPLVSLLSLDSSAHRRVILGMPASSSTDPSILVKYYRSQLPWLDLKSAGFSEEQKKVIRERLELALEMAIPAEHKKVSRARLVCDAILQPHRVKFEDCRYTKDLCQSSVRAVLGLYREDDWEKRTLLQETALKECRHASQHQDCREIKSQVEEACRWVELVLNSYKKPF